MMSIDGDLAVKNEVDNIAEIDVDGGGNDGDERDGPG